MRGAATPTTTMVGTLCIALGIIIVMGEHLAATARGPAAIDGIRVGHHTLSDRPTGCTVILAEEGAVGAVDVRGPAPGTREIALLDPTAVRVQLVHAIVLTGGSAFGLAAADGVMRYLDERDIGFPTAGGVVPIVPAAVLYDLNVGDGSIRPTAECGYQAATAATADAVEEGNVGAGAGATVGKVAGGSRAMKGGLGSSLIELPSGLQVAALMAVNAVGDVIDPETGGIVAGVRTEDGQRFADARAVLRGLPDDPPSGQNTTIGVVVTNAALTPAELGLVARMAQSGLARAVRPAHTPGDGDTIFALSTRTRAAEDTLTQIGSLAADATAEAIVRAVRAATSIPGYPASRDFKESTR